MRRYVCVYMVTKYRSSPRERPGIVSGVTWLAIRKHKAYENELLIGSYFSLVPVKVRCPL